VDRGKLKKAFRTAEEWGYIRKGKGHKGGREQTTRKGRKAQFFYEKEEFVVGMAAGIDKRGGQRWSGLIVTNRQVARDISVPGIRKHEREQRKVS